MPRPPGHQAGALRRLPQRTSLRLRQRRPRPAHPLAGDLRRSIPGAPPSRRCCSCSPRAARPRPPGRRLPRAGPPRRECEPPDHRGDHDPAPADPRRSRPDGVEGRRPPPGRGTPRRGRAAEEAVRARRAKPVSLWTGSVGHLAPARFRGVGGGWAAGRRRLPRAAAARPEKIPHRMTWDATAVRTAMPAAAPGASSTPPAPGPSRARRLGEHAAADRISYRVPDFNEPATRARYAGKGTPRSARAPPRSPRSPPSPTPRRPRTAQARTPPGSCGAAPPVFTSGGGGSADQLPARGALGLGARAAVDEGHANAVFRARPSNAGPRPAQRTGRSPAPSCPHSAWHRSPAGESSPTHSPF